MHTPLMTKQINSKQMVLLYEYLYLVIVICLIVLCICNILEGGNDGNYHIKYLADTIKDQADMMKSLLLSISSQQKDLDSLKAQFLHVKEDKSRMNSEKNRREGN